MEKKSASKSIARFDTKLPKAQKELFEQAAAIGGYRTLTDFIIQSAQEKAVNLIEREKSMFASQRDREIFFKAIVNPLKPNKALREAAKAHKRTLKNK
ncbi:MAG: DUF1778 domain-containing protein [Saprospiraceae bacterium]